MHRIILQDVFGNTLEDHEFENALMLETYKAGLMAGINYNKRTVAAAWKAHDGIWIVRGERNPNWTED